MVAASSCYAYLDFRPCNHYYNNNNIALSSLFGSNTVSLNQNQSRLNRATSSVANQVDPLSTMAIAMDIKAQETVNKKAPMEKRRVVVTGMGVETSLGHDPNTFYDNLLQGNRGISHIEDFDCSDFPTRIAGEIKSFSTEGWVAPKLSRRMDKFMLYLLTAAALGYPVNFENCREWGSARPVNVTNVRVNPYPLGLGDAGAAFTITANTTINVTAATKISLSTYSWPLNLNAVRKTYSLCNVTACPVTPGPVVFVLPIFIPKSGFKLTPQSEYIAGVSISSETAKTRTMCVYFKYQIVNWT